MLAADSFAVVVPCLAQSQGVSRPRRRDGAWIERNSCRIVTTRDLLGSLFRKTLSIHPCKLALASMSKTLPPLTTHEGFFDEGMSSYARTKQNLRSRANNSRGT